MLIISVNVCRLPSSLRKCDVWTGPGWPRNLSGLEFSLSRGWPGGVDLSAYTSQWRLSHQVEVNLSSRLSAFWDGCYHKWLTIPTICRGKKPINVEALQCFETFPPDFYSSQAKFFKLQILPSIYKENVWVTLWDLIDELALIRASYQVSVHISGQRLTSGTAKCTKHKQIT